MSAGALLHGVGVGPGDPELLTVKAARLIGNAAVVAYLAANGLNYRDDASNLEPIATRNRLIHGYLGIDDDTLWSIIRDDIPRLLPALQSLRDENK